MALFRKTEQPPTPAVTPAGGKGRPTPTRKQAEAKLKRPLVPDDRKAAQQAARARSREVRDREFAAMKSGDEKHLPLRDKGPVKRWIRDYVDARWNLGELFMPVAILFLFVTILTKSNPTAAVIALIAIEAIVFGTILEAFVFARRLRKKLRARFGEAGVARGNVMYAITRSFQIRRSRLPKPQVKRGEYPA